MVDQHIQDVDPFTPPHKVAVERALRRVPPAAPRRRNFAWFGLGYLYLSYSAREAVQRATLTPT